jgi:hypothetical protein
LSLRLSWAKVAVRSYLKNQRAGAGAQVVEYFKPETLCSIPSTLKKKKRGEEQPVMTLLKSVV